MQQNNFQNYLIWGGVPSSDDGVVISVVAFLVHQCLGSQSSVIVVAVSL